jgi:Uma2 family endonuclease
MTLKGEADCMKISLMASSRMQAVLPPKRRARTTQRRTAPVCPPLENGDMLPLTEFIRRYEDMPGVKKAQLIEGVVHMPSPVRVTHAEPDGVIQLWLGVYAAENGLKTYPNATLLLDTENAFQPDAILCSPPRKGGRVWLNTKGYLCGSPELVVEIASSTASIDLRDKLRVYRRLEVAEYIVWRTEDAEIDWFVLEEGQFIKMKPDRHGKLRSRIFPGLVLDLAAALACDKAKVLAALKK